MASITFRNVVKKYDGAADATVKGINLDIIDKEFVVLVGPSGCGKSTSLRMIAGLEDITDGTISIGDTVVNDLPPKERDIAMVFQNYALYPHMTVEENLSFGLKLRKMDKDEIKSRVDEAAAILGLAEYLERKPKQLSGGQRQRVALGRCIVREPKVFLMDEPLSNLDAKLRVQMRAEIKKLHQRLKTTFVYVTHDQVEAMTMADRIVLLHEGVIQQYDVPSVIYSKPANIFVATFIGSPPMNILQVEKTADGISYSGVEEGKAVSWKIDLSKYFEGKLPEKLSLGIRPEHILINDFGKDKETLKLECEVDLIEPMGSETYVYLKYNGQSINAKVDPATVVKVGDIATVHIPVSRFHIFDRETTKRIPRKGEDSKKSE
ncbi:MAG: sn-glycerol-3-phosphate ABC transporter ATP-binding protein UgpC [Candidatus Riflebacteria bacterium]|nr:sn-glycerol-3-phosphate ABC transporter ATP-binding protein UgpC [Candidatus Riflebacteria bacterium]